MYEIINADVVVGLRGLASESIQTCVTSPPYFGLRDYGTATWEGGDAGCAHKPAVKPRAERAKSGLQSVAYIDACQQPSYRDVCGKCGARRVDQQIGLEDTPDAYVARLVEVFREVRRVLKADGTCWLNLGDSYAGSSSQSKAIRPADSKNERNGEWCNRNGVGQVSGLKAKDLIGIPWRVAFALQADGWYLRQDIIWAKPNPMPESTRDRCTKAHEYVFLLAKSQRYFFDAAAIAEPAVSAGENRGGGKKHSNPPVSSIIRGTQALDKIGVTKATRNKRSVWTVTPKPYAGAHFAVMPENLVAPCILAGSRPGDTVLDPFTGSGTVGAIALRHGRHFVGTELNAEYIDLAHTRIGSELLPKAA